MEPVWVLRSPLLAYVKLGCLLCRVLLCFLAFVFPRVSLIEFIVVCDVEWK